MPGTRTEAHIDARVASIRGAEVRLVLVLECCVVCCARAGDDECAGRGGWEWWKRERGVSAGLRSGQSGSRAWRREVSRFEGRLKRREVASSYRPARGVERRARRKRAKYGGGAGKDN
jgi:hypothetical protein